jgi:nucleotide-binding universal stress UspA family protein
LDSTQILMAVLAVTWLAGGAAIAIAMRRSGHDFGLWLALGVLLGPFAALFAQERHRLDRQRGFDRITELRTGPFDAVAGIDGSEESISAVQMALSLFGDTLNSLTLVTALNYETRGSFTGIVPQSDAYSRLVDVASKLEFEPIEMMLLYGPPAETIARLAQEGGFELLILGARGHGMSEAFFGSVTAKLIGNTQVPVFVGPRVPGEVPASSTKTPPASTQPRRG